MHRMQSVCNTSNTVLSAASRHPYADQRPLCQARTPSHKHLYAICMMPCISITYTHRVDPYDLYAGHGSQSASSRSSTRVTGAQRLGSVTVRRNAWGAGRGNATVPRGVSSFLRRSVSVAASDSPQRCARNPNRLLPYLNPTKKSPRNFQQNSPDQRPLTPASRSTILAPSPLASD